MSVWSEIEILVKRMKINLKRPLVDFLSCLPFTLTFCLLCLFLTYSNFWFPLDVYSISFLFPLLLSPSTFFSSSVLFYCKSPILLFPCAAQKCFYLWPVHTECTNCTNCTCTTQVRYWMLVSCSLDMFFTTSLTFFVQQFHMLLLALVFIFSACLSL